MRVPRKIKRFKLTAAFLAISVATFAIAGFVITELVTRNEETEIVNVISAQSNKDARVFASMVTGLMAESNISSPSEPFDGESAAVSAFLRGSGIVRLSLFESDGALAWSSDETSAIESAGLLRLGDSEIISTLSRDQVFIDLDGQVEQGDVVATLVPLVDEGTGQTLEVARNVTEELSVGIESARSSMFVTVFGSLGGVFVVLLGLVASADVLLWRSKTRAVFNERKLSEEKIAAKGLELENQQLRQLNEERDRFLSMISHELRTPLTSMLGFTDVLARNQSGEKRDRNLRQLRLMRRNGDHLNSLVEDLLESTRIHIGQFEIDKKNFKVDDLVDSVVASAETTLQTMDQRLVVSNSANGAELYGDKSRLSQMALKLLSNASKYSPENSQVIFKVEVVEESLRMTITDSGCGIATGDHKNLFDRFFRANNEATRSQSGLGIGLSVVKEIVNSHWGDIEVESESGAGTKITVTLPGARTEAQIAADPVTPANVEELVKRRRELARNGDPLGIEPLSAS